jgi:hypothetical protein
MKILVSMVLMLQYSCAAQFGNDTSRGLTDEVKADEESRQIVSDALGNSFCRSISAEAIIEHHDDEDDHGDVCRYQTAAHGFFCPEAPPVRGRKGIACVSSTKPPFCLAADVKGKKLKEPCRVPYPEDDVWDEAAIIVKQNPKWSPLRALRIARAHQHSLAVKEAELAESMDQAKEETVDAAKH